MKELSIRKQTVLSILTLGISNYFLIPKVSEEITDKNGKCISQVLMTFVTAIYICFGFKVASDPLLAMGGQAIDWSSIVAGNLIAFLVCQWLFGVAFSLCAGIDMERVQMKNGNIKRELGEYLVLGTFCSEHIPLIMDWDMRTNFSSIDKQIAISMTLIFIIKIVIAASLVYVITSLLFCGCAWASVQRDVNDLYFRKSNQGYYSWNIGNYLCQWLIGSVFGFAYYCISITPIVAF